MKKHLTVQWVGVVSLLAHLAWGGSMSVWPSSANYSQTDLNVGSTKDLTIMLSGWGATNVTTTATIKSGAPTDIFNVNAETGSSTQATRSLYLTPLGKAGSTIVTVTVTADSPAGAPSESRDVDVSITAVPEIHFSSSTLTLNEDTATDFPFTVEYWGDASALTSWTTSVPGGSSDLVQAVGVSNTGMNGTLRLTPQTNQYGSRTFSVTVRDNQAAPRSDTETWTAKVQPVADASVVSSWPQTPITLSVGGSPTNHVFAGVTVSDDDHLAFVNGTSNEYLKASVMIDPGTVFFNSGVTLTSTNLTTACVPNDLTTWLHGLSLYPEETSYAPVGQTRTNTLKLVVYGIGANDWLAVTNTVFVALENPNHPPQYLPAVNPSVLQEGQTIMPFSISQLTDRDTSHTTFTLRLFVTPETATFATLSSSGTMNGNLNELNTQLSNIALTAARGVMSTLTTNVTVSFALSDSIDEVTNRVTLTINQTQTEPVINGIDPMTASYLINDSESLTPFSTVIIYDTDQGANQQLRASFSVSDPSLGYFCLADGTPVTEFSFRSQTDLQAAVRTLSFVPRPGALLIGNSGEVSVTLTVTDVTGLSSKNDAIRVVITAVNHPPSIEVPQVQPVLLPPSSVLHPFVGTRVSNDDSNAVSVVISLDDNTKGTLENLGGFSYASGVYSMSGLLGAINASLTNLTYKVSSQYVFPADDPGGTVFTLEAEDYQIKLGSAQLWVQVQDAPRNHLVTKAANDGTPGSLRFVLAHVSNNDVITFALPEYPAVIRVAETNGPLVLDKALTFKGPGADLLTLSGDGDGDGDGDVQIFSVLAHVTLEGLTLSHGHGSFGGAISVGEAGALTMRSCAVIESEAEQYGGAIDVAGTLALDACYFAGNHVTGTGFGGGAISFYALSDVSIINTTFASNWLENAAGYGGGAVYIERSDNISQLNVSLTHCTFTGNADASDHASAVYVNGGNTYAIIKNTVFSDYSILAGARNIDVIGDGWITSAGGNVCDDSTRTAYLQSGGLSSFLLTHVTDLTAVAPGVGHLTVAKGATTPYFPLTASSPALRHALSFDTPLDQRGAIRRSEGGAGFDAGAIQQNAGERVLVTEIQFSDVLAGDARFVELFVPYDSLSVNLAGYGLYVNGQLVHRFIEGNIINAGSTVFSGVPLPVSATVKGQGCVVEPGNGVVVAFPENPVSSSLMVAANPTPVVGASVVTNAAAMTALLAQSSPGRGKVSIKSLSNTDAKPIVEQTFLSVFIDPLTETNLWVATQNAIVAAPQAHGYAFLPHSTASFSQNGGLDRSLNTVNPAAVQSPGAWNDGTPFGLNNAFPQAVADKPQATEDDAEVFDLLANDMDANSNDRLSIVNLFSGLAGASGATNSISFSDLGARIEVLPDGRVRYDPRAAVALQALPAGEQVVDAFQYEVIDFGEDVVSIIAASNAFANGYVDIVSPNHRLTTNDVIEISGATLDRYNGIHTVSAVIDSDTFRVDGIPFLETASYGNWRALAPRTPSLRSQTTVSVTVYGLNDVPTGVNDVIATAFTERDRLRMMAYPSLATQQTAVVFFDDPVPAPLLARNESLLPNDSDRDTYTTWNALRIYGVVSPADVHAVVSVAAAGVEPGVTFYSPAHGLANGARVLVAGYGGAARYNGWQTVTVDDADHFTLPVAYEDIPSGMAAWTQALVWVKISEETRLSVVTPKGAVVTLARRANQMEDNVVYDAAVSSELQTLAEGETTTDRFFYLLEDPAGAIGIAAVDVTVTGVNNLPTTKFDPDTLDRLTNVLDGRSLVDVLTNGLTILTVCAPAESGLPGRADVIVSDQAGGTPTTETLIELPEFFFTDEDTALTITAPELVANDVDIDTLDNMLAKHRIASVVPLSVRGAAVSVDASGTNVTYNPSGSAALQALAQGEQVFDLFTVRVSDGLTNSASQVAVLVRGVNDAPAAGNVWLSLTNNVPVAFDPRGHATDVDVSDRLMLVATTNVSNAGGAHVDITLTNVASGTISDTLYAGLGAGSAFTNAISFTVTDNSLLVAVDDLFRVPMGVVGHTLDVLANDSDRTVSGGFGIASVTPSLRSATVVISAKARSLVYSAPSDFAGNDLFSYTVTNTFGISRTANVKVCVIRHAFNGPFHAADDTYALARGTTLTLPVLDNDNILPQTADELVLEGVIGAAVPGLIQTGNTLVYTATNAAVTNVVFAYGVNGGGTAHAVATVRLRIVDRPIKIQDDFFSAEPGVASVALDVLGNDALLGESTDGMTVFALETTGTVGSVSIGPDGTNVLYCALAGFRGVDHFGYHVIDRYGATGVGHVQVTVGALLVTEDFFQVATNTVTVLDVTANDRALPAARAGLTVTAVEKIVTNAIGSIGTVALIETNGVSALQFTASTVTGSESYRYVLRDAGVPQRSATGVVSLVTVLTDTLNINADSFKVRSGSSDVELDVLSNDVSYVQGRQALVITTVDTTGNHGGTVAKVGNDRVLYTPASGYRGEETFAYYATDAMGAARKAVVTVQVIPGDFLVNDDPYVIGYTWDGNAGLASAVELKLLDNDAILPANGETLTITSVGIGANAPSLGGTVTLAADGRSVFFRPGANPVNYGPSNEFTEVFAYEAADDYGRKQSARVSVRVRLRVNEIMIETCDDVFVVERGSTANRLLVLSNDLLNLLMPQQAELLHIATSAQYGTIESASDNTALLYTPPAGFVGVDTATYTISDGLGGSGTAAITIFVGALPTAADRFVVPAGSVSNRLNLTSNDAVTFAYTDAYVITNVSGLTAGGQVTIANSGEVLYTPAAGFVGTESFLYEVVDFTGGRTPGIVTVTVLDPAASYSSATAWLVYTRPGGLSGASNSVYAAWLLAKFTPAQILGGFATGGGDPDSDGLSNDAEYVFGGDPNAADASVGCVTLRIGSDGSVDVSYKRRINDPALVFHLYGTTSLAGPWTEIDSLATVTTQPDLVNTELATATHHVASPGIYRFFKVMVQLP